MKEKTKKIIYLVLWLAFVFSWFCPTTFPHLPPKYALIACFSLCLCRLQWRILKIHSDGPCCSVGITWCYLHGFLGSHCAAQVARCKFHEFKRVIRQNSLQASSDLVIDVFMPVFFLLCFSQRVCISSLPCKTGSKVYYGNDDERYRVLYENCTACCLEWTGLGFDLQHFEWEEDGGRNCWSRPQELLCYMYKCIMCNVYKFWKVQRVRF